MVDEVWLEAAAAVAADAATEVRLEAAEVYAAEAARSRLQDLSGLLRIQVRCGHVLVGRRVQEEEVEEHLVLSADQPGTHVGSLLVVPVRAVIVVDGAAVHLREEDGAGRPRSIGSWLRELWREGRALRILDRSGHAHIGPLAMVGADHVRLASGRCLPVHAVDAWWS